MMAKMLGSEIVQYGEVKENVIGGVMVVSNDENEMVNDANDVVNVEHEVVRNVLAFFYFFRLQFELNSKMWTFRTKKCKKEQAINGNQRKIGSIQPT